MLDIKTFFIIASIFGSCGLSSCTNSFNQNNYLICKKKLEDDRKKVRLKGGYSYEANTYDECRSPARYGLQTD